ncbi:hypothetical protein U1Q18_050980, partial [Sarracenia purpurea var. burkii]
RWLSTKRPARRGEFLARAIKGRSEMAWALALGRGAAAAEKRFAKSKKKPVMRL